jgi:hypothetical protein
MWLQRAKSKLAESAIDFALYAFWVGLYGVIVTSATAIYAFMHGISFYWIIGLASAAATFLLVLLLTASIVFLRKRASGMKPAPTGKKGLWDYKIQGQRSLLRMNKSMVAMTVQMGKITRLLQRGLRKMKWAQKGWGNPDERSYRAIQNTAQRLQVRASVLRLHAEKYNADVELFMEGFGKWADWVVERGDATSTQRSELAVLLKGFRESIDSTIPSMDSYCIAIEGSRESSESMDIVGGSLIEIVLGVIGSQKSASLFCGSLLERLSD